MHAYSNSTFSFTYKDATQSLRVVNKSRFN